MKRRLLGMAVLMLMVSAANAGQTYQMFDFRPGDILSGPSSQGITTDWYDDEDMETWVYKFKATVDQNPYGDPWTFVQVDNSYGYQDYPGYNATEDYLHASRILIGSGMYIPNSGELNPLKRIWVEIRYDPELVRYQVELPNGSLVDGTLEWDEQEQGSAWHVAYISWEIRPNPPYEYLWFDLIDNGAKVDYIKVWTQCVPAPGALLLAGVGTALVGWVRRRRAVS